MGGRRRRLSRGIEGAGGRRRRPVDRGVLGGEGDRIWRGGIAIEMEGDRDRDEGGIEIEMEGDRDQVSS